MNPCLIICLYFDSEIEFPSRDEENGTERRAQASNAAVVEPVSVQIDRREILSEDYQCSVFFGLTV